VSTAAAVGDGADLGHAVDRFADVHPSDDQRPAGQAAPAWSSAAGQRGEDAGRRERAELRGGTPPGEGLERDGDQLAAGRPGIG
jgi:hypothetical protein